MAADEKTAAVLAEVLSGQLGPRTPAVVASILSRAVPASSPQDLKAASAPESKGYLAALCKILINAAGPSATSTLYGDEIRSQVDEWLTFASVPQGNRDSVSSSARFRTLNSYLLTRSVFFGPGTSIGIADIALFVSIHDELAALAPEELNTYPNLLRWIDYVQNKDDVSHAYEWIPVQKAKFDPPAPSTQPESKKVLAASQGPSVKEKAPTEPSVPALVQEKQTATDAKVEKKDKKGKPEPLPAGKVVNEDAKTDQQKDPPKEKKAPATLEKDAFGLEILDIRVGIIKTVKKHPTAETLYVEEIDIGEGSLRQVVSGLAKYLTEDEMLNRHVLVLANVKPSKLRDVLSSGLVLCTSNEDHSLCDPVIPPNKATIGERVIVAGYEGKPEAVLNPKKKQWEKLYPDLHTDDTGVACYKGKPLTTSAGPCTSSIKKGTIK